MYAGAMAPAPDPNLSLIAILGYTSFAFLFGLALTPTFVRFLRGNQLGKQLRVEAVDGKEAKIFRKFHAAKKGTPTMGGLLIWGSILFTILFSRMLSLMGWVDFSLLQRGQVYLPLFTLVAMGILGAVDDYFNIAGIGRKRGLDVLPKIIFLLLISAVGAYWFSARLGYDQIHVPFWGSVYLG